MLDTVKSALEHAGLRPSGSTVFVGISGGADSVALLHLLNRLDYPLVAAHLNHSIRGADADADEQFVQDLCATLGIRCITQKTDVPALAIARDISLEMAAREARHQFFKSLPCPSFPVICLAHHADDQIETFFLRAARGTGLSGLGGMKAIQTMDGFTIVRPMLGIRRAEIHQWLQYEGLAWREDCTNTDESIPRNRVRHQILPVLEMLNPCAVDNILRTMDILREEDAGSQKSIARRQMRDWLVECGVAPRFESIEKLIEFSAQKQGTTYLDLEGLHIVNEYGQLSVRSEPKGPPSIRIEEGIGILYGPWTGSVSLTKLNGRAVHIRTAKSGDRMNPYGMSQSKKLQDIFTDLKIPKAERSTWPLVECDGEIIWIPGYRIARGWELIDPTGPALHFFSSPPDPRTPAMR